MRYNPPGFILLHCFLSRQSEEVVYRLSSHLSSPEYQSILRLPRLYFVSFNSLFYYLYAMGVSCMIPVFLSHLHLDSFNSLSDCPYAMCVSHILPSHTSVFYVIVAFYGRIRFPTIVLSDLPKGHAYVVVFLLSRQWR